MPFVAKMTAEQFLELDEDPPGTRLELVDGEVSVSPSPAPAHNFVVARLMRRIGVYAEDRDLGDVCSDVDTYFGRHDVRRPDILYFSKSRFHLIGAKAMEGPPDLAVEVISPSSVRTDREAKFAQYARGGVESYWIVDPEPRTIEAWTLRDGRYVPTGRGQGSDVVQLPPFPDLEIPLDKIWWT